MKVSQAAASSRGVALDGGGEVLVAEVEHGEADVFALFGDAGAEVARPRAKRPRPEVRTS